MKKKYIVAIVILGTLVAIGAYAYYSYIGLGLQKYQGSIAFTNCTKAELGCEEITFQTDDKSYILEGNFDFKKYTGNNITVWGVRQDGPPWSDVIKVYYIKQGPDLIN